MVMTIQSCSESHLNQLIELKKNTIRWEELIVHRVEGNSKNLVVRVREADLRAAADDDPDLLAMID